jgi:hypothetical protein
MALDDDLRAYISRRGQPTTDIIESHDMVIVGEIHAFLQHEVTSAIRTTATVRLILELLRNPRYQYFANENFLNAGPVRIGIRNYLQGRGLPPAFDPAAAGMDVQEIAERVITRRYQPVLDYLRAHPRYILSIGSRLDGPVRDARIAQHLFEEMHDRGLGPHSPGIILLGAAHAAAAPFVAGLKTTRMILEERGYKCVSIFVLTDLAPDGDADDFVIPLPIADVPAAATSILRPGSGFVQTPDGVTALRLTSLAANTPVTIPTDRRQSVVNQSSSFHLVRTTWSTINSLAEQYEYIVLQKS